MRWFNFLVTFLLFTFLSLVSLLSYAEDREDLMALQSKLETQATTQQNSIDMMKAQVLQNSSRDKNEAMQSQQAILQTFYKAKAESGVMIFVSLGMPTLALRQILEASQTYQVPVVIRGLIDNNFTKTTQRLYDILHPQNESSIASGVEINPLYFRQFNITQVPAVVAYKGLKHCAGHEDCPVPQFDVVYGNVPLSKALSLLSEKGEAAADIANTILARGNNNEKA